MYGMGTYSMQSVKEIRITDAFKSLHDDKKHCQTSYTFENCMSENLLQQIVEHCDCVPYVLANFSRNDEVFET